MIEPVYSAAPDRYEGKMKYHRCGKSGILLPEISLGLWHNFGDVDTLSNSRKKLHFAPILIWQIITDLRTVRRKRLSDI